MDSSTALRAVRDAPPLSRRTLRLLEGNASLPTYEPHDLRPSVVHLGLGSFARAHLSTYLDDLARGGISRDWGLVAAGMRTASVSGPLAGQDNLWTVTTAGTNDVRVVGVLSSYVDAVRERAVVEKALADPATRLLTLTVTASAYADADLEPRRDSGTFALVAAALERRRAAGAPPFTVLSCDNLPDNGGATRAAVLRAAEGWGPHLVRWIERHVAFPRSMVDRIVHCADDTERQQVQRRLGVDDRLAVVAEPFSQWVVADEFCAPRPPLEEVGVRVVSDVEPYVEAKTRLLNGSHVALGFLGERAGHRTAGEAMRDAALAGFVSEMMAEEVEPGLAPVPGLDLPAYRRCLLERLGDDAMRDPLSRLRRRGSVRVANYLVPSIRDAVAAGRPHGRLVRVLAAWIAHLAAATERRQLTPLEDPRAELLGPLAAAAHRDPVPLLSVTEVFGDLVRDVGLVAAVTAALSDLDREECHAVAS